MLAGMDNHEDGARFLRPRSDEACRRLVDLEDVTQRNTLAASLVDEEILLRTGDRMRIARLHNFPDETLLDWRRSHLARIVERLQRHGQFAVVNEAELHHDTRQYLLLLQRRDAHNSERHDDVAPPPELYRPVDAREQQRVANVIRGVLRRPNRDFLERRRARALRQTRNGRRRGGSEDTRPGQPFAFTQETGGVELAGAHRVVWLMGVRPQDIPHLLALGGATIEDRFV